MHLRCKYGTVPTTLVGELEGYTKVWFHPEGITNILSIVWVKNLYNVTYDSSKGNCFMSHKWNGGTR